MLTLMMTFKKVAHAFSNKPFYHVSDELNFKRAEELRRTNTLPLVRFF